MYATDIRPFSIDKKHLPCGDEIHSFPQVSAFPFIPHLLSVPEPGPVLSFGDHIRKGPFPSSGAGPPQGSGRTFLILSVVSSDPSNTGSLPGAGQDLRLFSSYLYISQTQHCAIM